MEFLVHHRSDDLIGGPGDCSGIGQVTIEAVSAAINGSATLTVTPGFVATGSLNTARSVHTATLLNNGIVLAAGGSSEPGYNASAELFQPITLTPPGLVSIVIAPATPTLSPGTTQQFIATGTFSDSSTQVLQSATWASSSTVIATISNDASNHGTAFAVAAGTSTITACTGTTCGSATLTVRPTGFVPTGSLNVPRYFDTETLLNNGKVLIAGGNRR